MTVTRVASASGGKRWYRSKTVITGIVALITAVGAYTVGEITTIQLIAACYGALMVIFFRTGMEGLK